MDEQALNDAYNLFTRQGYNGTIDQFKKLISTNTEALNDSYEIFRSEGYNGEIDNYKELIGLKKKAPSSPDLQIGGENLQDGFDFSPTTFEAPAVLTPKKQKEYIAEQKGKPAPIPAPETTQPPVAPTETLTVGPMGITGLQRTKDYKPAEEFKGKSAAYISGELLKTLGKGVVKFPADALETIAIGASAIDNLIAKTGLTEKTEASKLATYQAAQEYRKLIDEVVPTDKDIENGFWGQSANALGQMVPIILSGFTAGGAKAIATQAAKKGTKLESIINYGKTLASRMATPQGGLTISQVAAPSYSQAKSEGATENEALAYAIQNALVSYPIEMLPVDGLFKRLDNVLVGNKGVEILKRGVIGGSEEAITEGIQNVYENLSANQIYGTTKDFLEGTGNASAVGGTVGLITNGLLTALLGRRARATTNEEIVELDKSIEETKKKVEQINSNNERFIETINTLEQSKPRTLNYGSAEYNFIESPDGNLELAQDDITKEQAEGIIKNLSNTYKKIEFSVQEIEPEDPYQPTTYRVIGTPIKTEVTVEAPEIAQQRVDRIAEIETTITNDDAKIENPLLEGIRPLLPAERTKLQTELETLKSEQDAIQKQTAGQVPVLTEAGVGEEVVQGEPQAEPQVIAQEGVQEEVNLTEGQIRAQEDAKLSKLEDDVILAKKEIVRADDTEAAIEEYNKAKKAKEDYQAEVDQRKEKITKKINVQKLVQDETDSLEQSNYEYKELYDKDPRLAALQNAKDMLEFVESGDLEKAYIEQGQSIEEAKNNIKESSERRKKEIQNLEEDIKESPIVSLETQAPKFVRDISALITPATVRAFSPLTKRIQKLSLNYDKLVRQYAKKKDPKILEKIKTAETQILNDAKQDIIDAVAQIDGVSVKFNDIKRGLWDNAFEPSFNMTLSISPKADTKKLSDLLFDFAEKYSQDSFILESDSELQEEWVNGNIDIPLSEIDSNGLTNYPQIIYTFAEQITDEQLSDLSVALENNGIGAFNINNNELQVSVIFTEEQDANLTKEEQYEEREKDFDSKSIAAAKAVGQILGRNGEDSLDIRIKKSSYQGATNEGTTDQTRQFNKSDVLKAFKESTTKVETLAVELAGLRQKEIDLQAKGEKLSPKDKARFDDLNKIVQPLVQRTFETNKKLYEDAKTEIEGIAQDAISQVDASISPFPIKKPERASVKAIRWYNAFTEKLGDGARVNIVVDTDTNAEKVFKIIDKKYPGNKEVRRIRETTALGYPKRLIEIVTSNGTIAEIQVITNEAYLAKDGIKGFTGDEKQKSTAKQKLDSVRSRLGWNIPDGLGHYFYEIQRDTNVDDNLRDEAERLSDLYYDAFTNPKSKLSDSFMKDVMSFKEQVDAADKSEWDTGNKGIAPQSLVDYNTPDVVVEEEQFVPLTVADIEFDVRFSRENSSDVVEDEREGDNGRTYTYLSEVETPVSDVDGNEIGYLVKMVDEDKNLTFEARNENGSNLSKNEEGFDTLGEAKQALLNNYNKEKKKEFDREAKAKAKEKAKAALKEAAKKAKAEAKKPVVSETIDDLLDLDVADQDNLDRIFNALDRADKSIGKALGGANEAMLAIPLNVVRIAIKTLKGLVKGGMLLRDAIKKVAADNDISQDTIKDIINIAPIQDSFYALMEKVDALIARQKARGIQDSRITSNIDTYIRTQDEYLNANDAQKKIIEREARGKMGAAPKRAVSIGRVLGALKDITNISRAEKLKVISQIRQLSKDAAKDLAKEIRAMASSGRITANQAANIIARFGKVNMLSEISVSKFVDYMAKVFANAEYAAKLSAAKNLKKDISKLSKNKEKNANLRDLGSKFIKIDPTMVEDIDAYNDMASKIKEAIKGSTIRGAKVKFADTVNIENATEYINKTIEAQDEMMRQQKVDEIQELMGVDVSDLSYDDMMQLLDSKEPITKYNEGIIRSTIQKMFNIYSTLIDTTLDTGKDPFTDEDIDISKNKRDLIKRFMDMDLTVLNPKQALQAVDALANFFQNRSTAKMEAILAEYTGNANAKKLVKDGIVAQPLKKYWSPKIGRFLGEQTTNLNILFERMFKGFSRGGKVEDASGVTMLKNNKSMAQRESNNIVEKYIAEFYKKEANGEAYNSEYNSTERGLAAFMIRNIIGTEKQMQAEFNRRKGLIEQSIEVLSEGNEKEKAKAELYQTVYDNLIGPSKSFNENQKQSDEATNIQQVKDRVDKVNLEGIDFWNKEWADKYEQLSDVSENIYNKVLDKDLNYTPDKFVKLSTETGTVELSNDDSAFHNNNGTIYKKETGVLMTAVKPDKLPTNPKSGETSRYIDLSFDKNNSNSMYDALVDIGTAGPIRQIEGFLNSPDFKKIVPKAEDAKILKERIQLYVGNIRNKNPYSNDELSSMVRGLNRIASIGVGQALGGVFQPVKQMIPVAMNTLINAGNLDMGAIFDSAKNSFINRSGFAISNRGIESQAQVESLNKLIDEASKTKGEKLIKNIEKLNNWWLEKFLVKPDVFIARASWMTYYEQSLKKQGIDPKGIDYNTHEVNQEAAEYAQRMVDRQQNVSDSDLAGKMFSNKEATNQLFVKMLQPFASFRMNQSARFGSDLAVINDKTATPEDKKIAIKSLSGFAVEMATFKMISAGSAILLGSAAKWLMGDDEDEDDYKKRVNNVIKGQVTSSFNDVVSPLPILDKAFQTGGNFLTETMLDIPKESVFSIYEVPKQDYIQSLGLFGIAADRAGQLYDITKLSTTGEYVDDFGNKKTISEEKQKALAYLIGPAILSNVGLAPVEVNSIVRNSIKNAKKGTSGDGALTRSALERWGSSIDLSKMSKVAEFIKSKKEELSGKGDLAEKREFRKELEKDLLGKYEDKAQMRGADPELYKKNFGAESDWVKKGYAAEEILEAKFNTILNKKKNLIKIEELKKQK
jgi:hypothetical protein